MLPSSVLAVVTLLFMLSISPGQKSGASSQNIPAHIPLDGARIFQQQCASCHRVDGRGPATVALTQHYLHDPDGIEFA